MSSLPNPSTHSASALTSSPDVVRRDFERDLWCLLGLPIDATDVKGSQLRIEQAVAQRKRCFLTTPNLNFLIASLSDVAFRESVINSDWVTADGMPLVWLAKMLGMPIRERVPGSGLIEELRSRPAAGSRPIRIFFFGGPEGVAQKACEVLAQEKSGIVGVGAYYPGFGSLSDMSQPAIIDQINAAEADFVLVALGAKKGQAWIERNRSRLNAPVISHLGAVVNFIAGTVARAPLWLQKSGLEWLWRIYEEHSLFKRYWNDGLTLLRLAYTRAVPYAMYLRKVTPTLHTLPAADCHAEVGAVTTRIRVSGAQIYDQLQTVRRVFAEQAMNAQNIELVMDDCAYVDAAFIGQVMLLLKYQLAKGRLLSVTGVSPTVGKIFYYNNADYFLT